MTDKQQPPERIIVCVDGHKPVIADWAVGDMRPCDFEYARIHPVDDARVDNARVEEIRKKLDMAWAQFGYAHELAEDVRYLLSLLFQLSSGRLKD